MSPDVEVLAQSYWIGSRSLTRVGAASPPSPYKPMSGLKSHMETECIGPTDNVPI